MLVDILNEFGFAASGFKESDFLKAEQWVDLRTWQTSMCWTAEPNA